MTAGELRKKLEKLPDDLRVTLWNEDGAGYDGIQIVKRTWIAIDEGGCGTEGRTQQSAERKFDREIGLDLLDETFEALLIIPENFNQE